MKWQTHLKLISGIAIVALAGTAWYLFTDDVAHLDITEMEGKAPRLLEMRTERFPTVNIAKIVGWKGNAKPIPAAGLSVAAFAEGLDHPRWMHVLPNGDVIVAESAQPASKVQGATDWVARKLVTEANGADRSPDRITLLRDTDKDGKADFRSVLLSAKNGLRSPFGMQLVGDKLYVANTDALLVFPYKAGETQISAKGEKIVDLPAQLPNAHWTRNVMARPGEGSLLVTVGSNSNIGENGLAAETNRAAILEVFPKSKTFRAFATGLRNPNGLAVEPINGYLWTTVNERDMLGSDGPPDYLTWIDEGTFFGWPWFYWSGYVDHRVPDTRFEKQQYSRRPDYALGPHTASLGLVFAKGAKLGARFANGAFIGQHGSWNRTPRSGYRVIFVPFNERGFGEGKPVEVLTGFLNAQGEAQGRPAGVVIDALGGLLVADDAGNRIWRVTAQVPAAK
jgi:glucose/arabinose dehydrogenase